MMQLKSTGDLRWYLMHFGYNQHSSMHMCCVCVLADCADEFAPSLLNLLIGNRQLAKPWHRWIPRPPFPSVHNVINVHTYVNVK